MFLLLKCWLLKLLIFLFLLKQAIMALQSESYLKNIDEETALQMDRNDKSLFVFSTFSTPAFHHCTKVCLKTHTFPNLASTYLSSQVTTC